MMSELRQAAKDALGLYSIWIEDEQYDLIINAVLGKLKEMAGDGLAPTDIGVVAEAVRTTP